ncbi:arginine N-succinyltransferase [Psychromonas sp. RZ22]|uniref:arginine N-succinyltransferase n=1 Tax=Psychromonas algarum TaxID=2555643 RepID=UPI00106725C3|nr:arginine N-succinyltransferase [Psychromonas sp. RZ22]TEW54151.1 arginine N-succinyltransferase [Psychromonas sp. RZ22]
MMLIRPIQRQDKQALLQLATKTGTGFTSLPNNEQNITDRIERMIATWEGTAPLSDQGYLFALEDTTTKKVVGISGVEVAIGLNEPWYDFHVGTQVHASKELGIYRQMKKLSLSNDHTGHSELCTLFLDPEYRKNKNGQLLSKSRLMFIAAFKEKFSERIIAEMRGVSDQEGESPFWESLGRHFFSINFTEADYLTGIGQKSFIAELMPKHAFYVDFLTEAAKEVIAEVHPSTQPARNILESEGMRYEGYVDIFDAGPTLEAYTKDLRVVRKSQLRKIVITTTESLAQETLLIGNEKYQDFRAIIANPQINENEIYLTQEQTQALSVNEGEQIRIVPLFEKEKK